MGIKDLTAQIKKIYPEAIKQYSVKNFKGCKIAIDIDILVHEIFSVEYKNALTYIPFGESPDESALVSSIIKTILQILSNRYVKNQITPIIVASGKAPPEKDLYARAQRRAERQDRLNKLKEHTDKFEGVDDIPVEEWEKWRKLKGQAAEFPRGLMEAVLAEAEQKGYIVLCATAEAEELCATLCLEDRVQAVYSTDSDLIVRRCPVMIREFIDVADDTLVECVCYSEELIAAFEMTYKQFVDYCIMLGCDYNKRIPGLGAVTVKALILEYRSITTIANTGLRNALQSLKDKKLIKSFPDELPQDISGLNHERCRDIFNLNCRRDSENCCENKDQIQFLD